MNALLFFVLAIVSPVVLAMTFFAPIYAGLAGAAYIVYDSAEGPNPLADHLMQVFYMIDVYDRVFRYWLEHMHAVSMLHYTMPLLALPLASLVVSVWLSRKAMHLFKDWFQRLGGNH